MAILCGYRSYCAIAQWARVYPESGLLRVSGESNIAAACRRLAARPHSALALIGLLIDN